MVDYKKKNGIQFTDITYVLNIVENMNRNITNMKLDTLVSLDERTVTIF